MNKRISYIATTILVAFLLGTALGRSVIPSSTTYLMGGSLAETSSYLMWRDGSDYFCKDGETGQMIDSTNASYLMQYAVTNGDHLFMKSGQYLLDSTVTLDNWDIIEGEYQKSLGEGSEGTELILSGAITMFHVEGSGITSGYARCISLKNLRLDGGGYAGIGLNATYTHYAEINNCVFYNFLSNAIYAAGCWEWNVVYNAFVQCGDISNPINTANIYIQDGDDAGGNSNSWHIKENTFQPKAISIYSDMSGASGYAHNNAFWITENWFHGYSTTATRPTCYMIEGAFGDTIISFNNFVYSNLGFMNFTETSTRLTIIGNEMSNAKSYMIYFDGTNYAVRARIASNYFGYHRHGETTDAPSTVIIYNLNTYFITATSNQAITNTATPRLMYGSSTNQVHKYSLKLDTGGVFYKSENSGIANVTDGDTISHGLIYTPTTVQLTLAAINMTVSYAGLGLTTFTVHLTHTNGSAISTYHNVAWYTEYQPC